MDDIGFVSRKARRSEAPHRKLNAGDLSLVMSSFCAIVNPCQPQLFGASNANHSLPELIFLKLRHTLRHRSCDPQNVGRVVTRCHLPSRAEKGLSKQVLSRFRCGQDLVESWKRVEAHQRRSKWNREIIWYYTWVLYGFVCVWLFLYVFVILIPFIAIWSIFSQHFGINPLRIIRIIRRLRSKRGVFDAEHEETDAALRRAKKETAGHSSFFCIQ